MSTNYSFFWNIQQSVWYILMINCQLKTFPFQSVYGHQWTPGNDSFMNYDVPTALGLSNREAH